MLARGEDLTRLSGIENLSQLQRAACDGRLRALAGFGSKTEQRILDSMAAKRVFCGLEYLYLRPKRTLLGLLSRSSREASLPDFALCKLSERSVRAGHALFPWKVIFVPDSTRVSAH